MFLDGHHRRLRRFHPQLEWLELRLAPALSPAQICHAYGIDKINFNGQPGDGTGQTIAITDQANDPTIISDLAQFDSAQSHVDPDSGAVVPGFNLPGQTEAQVESFFQIYSVINDRLTNITNNPDQRKNQPTDTNGVPGGDGAAGEITLDVEWAHAIAPGADIDLVEYDDNYDNVVNFAKTLTGVNQAQVSVVSMSILNGDENLSTFSQPGVTFVAATGDWGWPGGAPADCSNVLAVGGTQWNVDSKGNFANESGWIGSGGGTSTVEPEPTYQESVQNTNWRTTPDVAFDAITGVATYEQGWFPSVGTSYSCPAWAGLIAIANQGRVAAGEPLLNSTDPQETMKLIYGLPSSDFNSVGQASNAIVTGVTMNPGAEGSGYTATVANISAPPPGPDAKQATLGSVLTQNGHIIGIDVADGGGGYTAASPPTVTITQGEGTLPANTVFPCTIDPTTGAVTGVTIPGGSVGTGYLSVDFTGGATADNNAQAYPVVDNDGHITGVTFPGLPPGAEKDTQRFPP